MKCKHCGSNLNIEDRYCPYCGEPNPYAVRHQKEMDRYDRDYQETKKDVLEQSTRFNRRTVRVTIIAIMIAMIAAVLVLIFNIDNIRYWREDRDIAAHSTQYKAEIDRLMEDRDYLGVNYYFTENHISYAPSMTDYDNVYASSQRYKMFYNNLLLLQSKKAFPDKYTYYTESEIIEDIAKDITGIYEELKPSEYFPERTEGKKMEYMEALVEHMETLTAGYFGITTDEAREMRSMTTSRISVMLEDSYEKQN